MHYPNIEKCLERIQSFHATYNQLIETTKEIHAEWYEVSDKELKLSQAPLDPGSRLGNIVKECDCSWIFTSATLAVGNDFSHFQNRLGIQFARAEQWLSPFRYDEQALLFLPPNMGNPNSPQFNSQVADIVRQIVPLATGGNIRFVHKLSSNETSGQDSKVMNWIAHCSFKALIPVPIC